MALGLNFLFRLGRRFLAAPVEESGLLPGRYYASQALKALADDDFCSCLRYLTLQGAEADPLLVQLLILRCRLLREKHQQEGRVARELAARSAPQKQASYQEVLAATEQAIGLLDRYLNEAGKLLSALEATGEGDR